MTGGEGSRTTLSPRMASSLPQVPPQVLELLEAIRQNHESGAAEIVRSAAQLLVLFAQRSRAEERSQLDAALRSVLRRLINAQPAMTPLLHLAIAVLRRVHSCTSVSEYRRVVRDAAKEFVERVDRESKLIAPHLLTIVEEGKMVLTISRSSTLLDAFRWIHSQGSVFRVLCAESLPGGEGVRVVEELGRHGITVELFPDDDLDRQLRRVQVVLVGADTVSQLGVINKRGTRRLALFARRFGIPAYVVAGSTKFLPAGLPLPAYSEELFDVTPLKDISGAICEEGVLEPARVFERLPQSEMLGGLLSEA